ncbi:MAG: hypothetical protein JXQ99_20390 [Hyphomicrobiaceae bacterium]
MIEPAGADIDPSQNLCQRHRQPDAVFTQHAQMNRTASAAIQNIQPKTSKIDGLRPSKVADAKKYQVTHDVDNVRAVRLAQIDRRLFTNTGARSTLIAPDIYFLVNPPNTDLLPVL